MLVVGHQLHSFPRSRSSFSPVPSSSQPRRRKRDRGGEEGEGFPRDNSTYSKAKAMSVMSESRLLPDVADRWVPSAPPGGLSAAQLLFSRSIGLGRCSIEISLGCPHRRKDRPEPAPSRRFISTLGD